MTQYLVAIYLPENYDPGAVEDEAPSPVEHQSKCVRCTHSRRKNSAIA